MYYSNKGRLSRAKFQELIHHAINANDREFMIKADSFAEIPKEIGLLTSVQWLLITGNTIGRNTNIGNLPSEIGNLTDLRILDLHGNKISSLPAEIGKLTNLVELNIWGNNLSDLPLEIGNLEKLETLVLGIHEGGNQIKALLPEIAKLVNLKKLFASNNLLEEVPFELTNMTKLQVLDLRENKLPVPPEILAKVSEPTVILQYLRSLYAHNSKPLTVFVTLPKELREQEKSNVKRYLENLLETSRRSIFLLGRPLNELKLLFVGQGAVGKTSIIQQILHGKFDLNQNKTDGISINQWYIIDGQSEIKYEESRIKLNIWDFGGQEVMHATHQFFLTKRSLYLLVLDARLTQEENRVEYWLKIIQSFGSESPVLIVGNKTDQHPLDIDRTGLQKKYPNIVGILETSAATGAGIELLKAEIAKQVDMLPHIRDLLPEAWFTVKSKLEELAKNKNFFTQDEYLRLCDTNEVKDEDSQHTLIGFLHDLGVVLHFQDDPRLESLGILNPQWVTNGVYKILNSHELFQNQGILTLSLLNQILNLTEYPRDKRLFIVDMMKKFELCYDIQPDKSFLVPDLLPKDEIYTGEWKDALTFQYHYNVLPSSIITRFIVRINAFIHKNTIWRSGVVLKRYDNTALVKADTEEKKIYIWVSGKEDTRRDLLAIIRGEFDAIHKTIAKIEATEKVPLPNVPEATPVDLIFLEQLAHEGRESLPVQAGNRIIDLIIKEVLSQIQKDITGNITINVGGNVDGNIIAGDENKASVNARKSKKKRKI